MQKRYNILVSAYACEPNKGSEPGIGWNWVREVAKRGHMVYVVTRSNNKYSIEQVSYDKNNISIIYYDLPLFLVFIKKIIGVNAYYFLWQLGVLISVKTHINEYNIDFIHHITFGSIKKYSFLGFLNKPFYYGPLGGGEQPTNSLLSTLPINDRLFEILRIIINKSVKYNPIAYLLFRNANKIFVTSSQSKSCLPVTLDKKIHINQAIGISIEDSHNFREDKGVLKFLYVGRLLPWKGIHITLAVLKEFKKLGNDFKFTIVGSGSYENKLKNLAKLYDIESNIHWISWIEQNKIKDIYLNNDVFLFPSMHDSGGMVVLEAMSYGLPVVCFNIGGPSHFVKNDFGYLIEVNDRSKSQVLSDYLLVLQRISSDKISMSENSIRVKKVVKLYSWKNIVNEVYTVIEDDFIALQKPFFV